jgi:hypothetical protein
LSPPTPLTRIVLPSSDLPGRVLLRAPQGPSEHKGSCQWPHCPAALPRTACRLGDPRPHHPVCRDPRSGEQEEAWKSEALTCASHAALFSQSYSLVHTHSRCLRKLGRPSSSSWSLCSRSTSPRPRFVAEASASAQALFLIFPPSSPKRAGAGSRLCVWGSAAG